MTYEGTKVRVTCVQLHVTRGVRAQLHTTLHIIVVARLVTYGSTRTHTTAFIGQNPYEYRERHLNLLMIAPVLVELQVVQSTGILLSDAYGQFRVIV